MRKWGSRVIVTAVLLAVAYWGWRVFFPNPEELIRKQLHELARAASTSSGEGLLAKAWNASKLAEYFTVDVEITLDVPGLQHTINGRDELVQAIAGARSEGRGVTVMFPDIKIVVAPDGQSAVVNLTAEGKVSAPKELYIAELKLRMIRIKRNWRIQQLETVKTLSFNHRERRHPCRREGASVAKLLTCALYPGARPRHGDLAAAPCFFAVRPTVRPPPWGEAKRTELSSRAAAFATASQASRFVSRDRLSSRPA
jgi:hypothetical protein